MPKFRIKQGPLSTPGCGYGSIPEKLANTRTIITGRITNEDGIPAYRMSEGPLRNWYIYVSDTVALRKPTIIIED